MRCIKDFGETQKNENGIVICDEPIKKVKPKMKEDFFQLCAKWPKSRLTLLPCGLSLDITLVPCGLDVYAYIKGHTWYQGLVLA
jgi:hypothetical protein